MPSDTRTEQTPGGYDKYINQSELQHGDMHCFEDRGMRVIVSHLENCEIATHNCDLHELRGRLVR